MRKLCILLVLSLAWTAWAATTRNDDSCDIGVAPAATLLLPYFEVDVDDASGETTIFTITNVTNVDRIARVTLWTDYAFPVLTFNVQLTGYGVQSISLYDVIARGVIAQHDVATRGRYSRPNPASTCDAPPAAIPAEYVAYMHSAFLEGVVPANGTLQACKNVGDEHDNAVGYATIDLVSNCSTNNPFAEQYWTEDIAFDNVLIGDYQQVNSANDFAQGSPMVHIRAIPEGGTPAERIAYHNEHGSHFTRTFYGRLQPWYEPVLDSRQPLPSAFAARWIEGGSSGFRTDLKIWREGTTGHDATCETQEDNVAPYTEFVRFDEAENAVGLSGEAFRRIASSMYGYSPRPPLPATLRASVSDTFYFPRLTNGAPAGWIYMNLDNDQNDSRPSQNWVVTSMRAEGRYSVDMDAAALGNGCSAQTPDSEITTGNGILVGPRP